MSIWLTVVLIINTLFLSVIGFGVGVMAYMDIQESRRAKNSKPPRIYCYRCDEEIKEEMDELDDCDCGGCCADTNEEEKVTEEVKLVKVSRVFQCL